VARRALVAGLAPAAAILSLVAPPARGEATGAAARASTAISIDTAAIWQDAPDQTTTLTIVSASRDLTRRLGLFGRIGMVRDRSAIEGPAWGVSNPATGATLKISTRDRLQLAVVFGTTLPLGSGGGDRPGRPQALRAMLNGTDWGGAMFGPNHIDVFEGFRVAASVGKTTLRVRSTLHPARRVRGGRSDTLGRWVIFASSAASIAYAPVRRWTVFGELSETRYLNRPAFLGDDPAKRSDHYAVAGLAFDVRLGAGRHLQPTLSVARAVDAPKNGRAFRLAELEVQLSF